MQVAFKLVAYRLLRDCIHSTPITESNPISTKGFSISTLLSCIYKACAKLLASSSSRAGRSSASMVNVVCLFAGVIRLAPTTSEASPEATTSLLLSSEKDWTDLDRLLDG